MTGPLALGVDGGNSKTVAALVALDGTVVGTARGRPSDIYVGGPRAIDALEATVVDALADAGATADQVVAAVFSLAGADWPEDLVLLESSVVERLGLGCDPIVMNDAIGGLWSATPDGEGVAVVLGTFNAVGARHRDGSVFHCGFWPDRTGGFDLGTEALKAVYREGLDLGPATALTPPTLALFGAADPLDLLHAFTRREDPVPAWDAQRLCGTLLDCADAGDEVALAIVRQAGGWLGAEARVCAERVGLDPATTPVVFAGGVAHHPSPLLPEAIGERLGGASPQISRVPPVVGAIRCALAEAGTPTDHHASRALADALA